MSDERTQQALHIAAMPHSYVQDGLASIHNNEFMQDEAFMSAYARGVQAVGQDYGWHWRVHLGLWAASMGAKLAGDFVECGVNFGFMSSSIMHHLNWDVLNKTFYLLDTFSGVDDCYVSQNERAEGILEKDKKLFEIKFYTQDITPVIENFSEWKNIAIIPGAVPDTLHQVKATDLAFLHLDMNCAPPEVAALEYFWDKLVPGAPVLLDDYAYYGYHHQKYAMDNLAKRLNICIASLPTGQGLIIKP